MIKLIRVWSLCMIPTDDCSGLTKHKASPLLLPDQESFLVKIQLILADRASTDIATFMI